MVLSASRFAPLALALALPTFMTATPAAAQAAEDMGRTLTVTGQGEAYGTPDMAMMQFGVTSTGKTAKEALEANATAMTSVRERLRRLGVDARSMQTSNFSLNHEYARDDRGRYDQSEIVGYNVNNTLSVRLQKIGQVGPTIDAAVSSGANRLNSLSFGFKDQTDLENEAKRAAVRDARSTAELLAEAAGVSLGRVMTITSTSYRSGPQPVAMARMEMADAASTPIEAGESQLTANITIVYELN